MKIYLVIEDVDAYAEEGGGEYPVAIFLNCANAEKYAEQRNKKPPRQNYSYYVQTWETKDEEV